MRPSSALLGAVATALLAATASAQLVRVARTPQGVAVDWTGGTAVSDVVALDLGATRSAGSVVELGVVRSVECKSQDKTTRGGNEDRATSPALIGYLVGSGGDYGPSSTGTPRHASGGDCSGGEPTQAQFCARWRQDSLLHSDDPWTGNEDPAGCDLGRVDVADVQDALTRTNLYRWMCGLAPVVEDPALSAKCQQGAALLRGIGYLTHQPEPGSSCYTSDGDVACGSSNISAGYPSLAEAVDAYVSDWGVSSLGHRRWLLHPPLQRTGFGFVQGAGTYAAQWIIGSGSTVQPPFVAWPSPGWFPGDAPMGTWSFSVKGADFSSATVSVTRLSDGRSMTVSGVGQLPNGYAWNCLAFEVAGCAAGNEYRVVVDGVANTAQSRYEYVTKWCNC